MTSATFCHSRVVILHRFPFSMLAFRAANYSIFLGTLSRRSFHHSAGLLYPKQHAVAAWKLLPTAIPNIGKPSLSTYAVWSPPMGRRTFATTPTSTEKSTTEEHERASSALHTLPFTEFDISMGDSVSRTPKDIADKIPAANVPGTKRTLKLQALV